jgi:hypothetical protein
MDGVTSEELWLVARQISAAIWCFKKSYKSVNIPILPGETNCPIEIFLAPEDI